MVMSRLPFIIRALCAAFISAAALTASAEDRDISRAGLIDNFFPRKQIDTSLMGVNAFVNDSRFGTIKSQFEEVRDTLRLKYVRVLFTWDDNVQPSPTSPPNFSFYDDIAKNIPRGTQALVILTGVPSWVSDSANWSGGSARVTFIRKWVSKVIPRYQKNSQIKAYQIWNEPNDSSNALNDVMGFTESPETYVDMLKRASKVIRKQKKRKRVVSAATTAINQGYPRALDYNRAMRDAGAERAIDFWGVHYYGSHYENVLRSGGVSDYLNGLSKPIWMTESGATGINEQLEYVERTWPFLKEEIPGIVRFYLYQFTDATEAEETYGLKNLTPGFTISDLYIYLRDRPAGS
jgi:hypothetical protein